MQDFTGVPAIVDLAAMRAAMENLKGNPEKINPLIKSDKNEFVVRPLNS